MKLRQHLADKVVSSREWRKRVAKSGICAACSVLASAAWTWAAPEMASDAARTAQFGLDNTENESETISWNIIRIVAPEHDQERGTIFFGVGEETLNPSALRGPR